MSEGGTDHELSNRKVNRSGERSTTVAALLLATLALVASSGAMVSSHPPRIFPGWVIATGIGLLAAAVALWASSCTSRRALLIQNATALIMALTALSVPLLSYFSSFNDFPWLLLAPTLILLLIGGWTCHQRWLSVTLAGLIAFFVATAREAPQDALQKSLSTNGLTVTVESMPESGGLTFLVRSAPGTRIEEEIDLKNIRLDGKVCRILPVSTWRPRLRFPDEDELASNEARMSATIFPPRWSRTMDLSVWLPLWPSDPATSVTVPMPLPGEKSTDRVHDSAENGVRLSVGRVRWSTSRTTSPAVPVVTMVISYEGPQFTGWTSKELRVRDQNGRPADLRASSISGSGGGTSVVCEIFDIAHGATDITVDLFTHEQREEASEYLRFGRLPFD